MEVKEPSPLNIDELAKKIEERIKALEGNKTTVVDKPKDIEMTSEEKAVISNFDQILEEIERRIQELDEEAVSEFDRVANINEDIIRHIVVKRED